MAERDKYTCESLALHIDLAVDMLKAAADCLRKESPNISLASESVVEAMTMARDVRVGIGIMIIEGVK